MKRSTQVSAKSRGRTGNISQVKVHFSEYLKTVQEGHVVTVTNRDQPVAKIVPFSQGAATFRVRKPFASPRDLGALLNLPPVQGKGTDTLSILLEDRRDS